VGKKGDKLISILDLSIVLTDSELEELEDSEGICGEGSEDDSTSDEKKED
jgi:hypothetical protein